MTINLIDARRGLYDKCLELFADKNIAEKIYRYLCDGIEDCEEAEPKKGRWIVWGGMDVPENHGRHKCSECREFALLRYEKPLRKEVLSHFCPNCGAKMEADE